MKRIGILGGTFDPIHNGHLDLARAAADALTLDEVRLVPSHVPPHREEPGTAAHHRLAMVKLAAQADPRLTADDMELQREGPSYAADTLRDVQQQGLKANQLFFLTGADAFAEIATWKGYPALLNLAHFVVCSRPGQSAAMVRGLLPALQDRMVDARDFTITDRTRIVLLDARTADVSSTAIREMLARSRDDVRLDNLLPPPVRAYIRAHGLYNSTQSGSSR